MDFYRDSILSKFFTFIFCLLILPCSPSSRFGKSESQNPSNETGAQEQSGRDSLRYASSVRNNFEKPLLTLEGVASFYADDFHGKLTANGEVFDMNDLTAAHRTLPFGTKIRVTNLTNGKKVIVRVNDRGPFVEGRIIDMSLAAAKEIGFFHLGTTKVKLEVLEWGDGKLIPNP